MTAQISDFFLYRQNKFDIAGISEGELFDIATLDLQPQCSSTACWRGYQAIFGLDESQLVLDTLRVSLYTILDNKGWRSDVGPIINGSSPSHDRDDDSFNNHYDKLKYPLTYSGGLLIARDLIYGLHVHMGFDSPWKYRTVVELTFEEGVLKHEFDRSQKMAEFREQAGNRRRRDREPLGPEVSDEQLLQFIRDAFDRTY